MESSSAWRGLETVRVAILGVGAIGSLMAAALADTDADLLLYARGAKYAALTQSGVVLHSPEGEVIHHQPQRWVVIEGEVPTPLRSCADVAIICGKADSTTTLAKVAEELLKPRGIAFSIQNGLGHWERLVARIGRHRVLAGSTTHAAMRIGSGEVRWTGRGFVRLASLDESELDVDDVRVHRLLDLLEDAQLIPQWEFDVHELVWNKLLINVAINPLAAICGVRNGELLAQPELHEQALAAMREAVLVAEAEGVDMSHFDCEVELDAVLSATAANRCSMLQDVMAGRATEIESICGEVVRRGEELGIPTPLNQQLLVMVKGIQNSNLSD